MFLKWSIILYRILTVMNCMHTWNNKLGFSAKIVTMMCGKKIISNGCSYIIDNFKHFNGMDIKIVNSKEISLPRSSWMMKFDHYKIILRALSCNKSILLLLYWLWNIQVGEQYLNWDSKKAFINVSFWWKVISSRKT